MRDDLDRGDSRPAGFRRPGDLTARPFSAARGFLVAALLAIGIPTATEAQVTQARTERAVLQIPVSFTVPVRLDVSQRAPAQAVGQGAGYTEFELPLSAAANLDWSLTFVMDAAGAAAGIIAVQNAAGFWETASGGREVVVVSRREPTNPVELRVRIRAVAGTTPSSIQTLRFRLEPAEGGER